jgi:cytochrome c oxidase subunit 1
MAIAVPTGIKIFNWLFTMWGGQIKFTTANLWTIGFIPSFVIGGMTGVMLSVPPADYQYHDSYFVVAHFHYVIIGGVAFGLFAGAYYWWPKMFGRLLNETIGKISFWLFFFGFHFTFFPQHFLGLMGMPRRVFTYNDGLGFDWLNQISTVGAMLMGVSTILITISVVMSFAGPRNAPADPWDGRTLEWAIPSPPPEYNFKQTPLVRGLDPLFIEKTEGKKEMTPAEPIGDIHMPNGSILPFIMSVGMFIAGLALCLTKLWDPTSSYILAGFGMLIFFVCMFIRSFKYDPGYHIHAEDLEDEDGGVKA